MRLKGKKTFITQVDDYMGPAINELFANEGAVITTASGAVPADEGFSDYIAPAGDDIDILIANLVHSPCNARVADISDRD
ncbi:MAG: hypothetical protein ISP91_07830, partial [Pseudomonadales bacterium]|nr:hypothetical protein [Pseudomonadales bacterium]